MMWTLDLTSETVRKGRLNCFILIENLLGTLSHWPKHAVDWSFFNVDEHSIRNWWIQFMAKTLDSRGNTTSITCFLQAVS